MPLALTLPVPPLGELPAIDAPAAAWQAYAATVGAHVGALPLGAEFTIPNQPPLIVATRGWDPDTVADARVTAAGHDYAKLMAALGPAEKVLATTDGRGINVGAWCPRDMVTDGPCLTDHPVYYARFTPAGNTAHGWACNACRCLVQTG